MSCDAYEMWRIRERELNKRLARCPVCYHCDNPIQDERLFDINGNLYHEECAFEEFRKWTEDYDQ